MNRSATFSEDRKRRFANAFTYKGVLLSEVPGMASRIQSLESELQALRERNAELEAGYRTVEAILGTWNHIEATDDAEHLPKFIASKVYRLMERNAELEAVDAARAGGLQTAKELGD